MEILATIKSPKSVFAECTWSFRKTLIFWWVLFVVIQQGERLFLLRDAYSLETPTLKDLFLTLMMGFQADLATATILVAVAGLLAAGLSGLLFLLSRSSGQPKVQGALSRYLLGTSCLVWLILLLVLTVDMGYYGYQRQHLDFTFFEYLENVLVVEREGASSQAALQTAAELRQTDKWGPRLIGFFALEGVMIFSWWYAFGRFLAPALRRWGAQPPLVKNLVLGLGLVVGGFGAHPYGPFAAQKAGISSSVYFTLVQNSFWCASSVLVESIQSRAKGKTHDLLKTMPLEEAIGVSREILDPKAVFPFSKYPFVRQSKPVQGLRLTRPANVLLIFVEGLDRRYLGRTINPQNEKDMSWHFIYEAEEDKATETGSHPGIKLTPFLDQLKKESLYFQHFYANGFPTYRGLFSTLCSYFPKVGAPELRTRHTHNYLCLPSVLRRFGYRTEMVIGFNRDEDRHHIGLFMARNGVLRLYDESNFPATAERVGSGLTDEAIFSFMKERLEVLQRRAQPFLLAGVTLGTHHPFIVPVSHPEVRALQGHNDPYVHTLRFLDLALERFFTDLQRIGLLNNTIVVILGDHGRSTPFGRTETERQVSSLMAPLFIWFDPSLHFAKTPHPLVVEDVASQVDVTPTILSLNGLMPRYAPFLGRDLSCVAVALDCLRQNVAYLNTSWSDTIGFVDQTGILLHSIGRGEWIQTDHDFGGRPRPRIEADQAGQTAYGPVCQHQCGAGAKPDLANE
jgi:Sulfatase